MGEPYGNVMVVGWESVVFVTWSLMKHGVTLDHVFVTLLFTNFRRKDIVIAFHDHKFTGS